MIDRRDILRCAGAGSLLLSAPAFRILNAAEGEQLPARPIPGTNEALPVVGLGNAVAFSSGNLELSRRLLEIFLERGGAYVDTTGPSRFTVADVVRDMGAFDKTFIATYAEDMDGQRVRDDVRSVLSAQGQKSLDLLLTRNVGYFASNPDVFRAIKDAGQARYVGVARHQERFHRPMMDLMDAGAVDFVQVNYSMLEPQAEQRLLPMARDKGVAIVVNRPFINGEWFSIVRGRPLPDWAAEFDCDSWAQFSLKFILSHPAVNCVLTETSNPEHVVDNIGGGIGRLPDRKTRRRMRELVQGFV